VIELELKLALPPGQAERLKRHPALRAVSPHRAVVADLDAIYFDTPSLELHAQGIAVRLREADGRWVQTVKTRGQTRGALHRRPEWEEPSDGVHLDFSRIDDSGLRRLLASPAIAAQLQPVFRTRFRRWSRLLVLPDGTQVELALDLGHILAGERSAAISEIELELKSGRAEALYELALALLPGVTLTPEPRSKAERGHALHVGTGMLPMRARIPEVSDRCSTAQACAQFLGAGLEQFERNLAGAVQGVEVEFLHQARVALRRLRAILGLFRSELPPDRCLPLSEGLRWLMAEVGPARDWDVFCTETLPAVQVAFTDRPALAELAASAADLRRVAQQRAATALASARTTGLLLETGRLATELAGGAFDSGVSLREFSRRTLRKRARRTTLSREVLAGLDSTARHDWRIALKKLRYSADFLSPVLRRPGASRRWIAALSSLQDVLGALNDAATITALLKSLPAASPDSREAVALLRGFVAGACQIRMESLEQARDHLEQTAVPWKRRGEN
jgi:inorganic triphosphatase YgiF